jgi:hypothetical protein
VKPDAAADQPETPDMPETSRDLTPEQMKKVVRRAVDLQDGKASGVGEAVSEAEMVRIGRELGLDPATVRRAMAEVRSEPDKGNVFLRAMGSRFARGQRVVPHPPDDTAAIIEHYLRRTELMVPERRFPDRIRYARDASLAATVGRVTRRFSRAHPPLNVERVDVTVSALDADSTLVEISADLREKQLGFAIASVAIGAPLSLIAFATIPITDPWILLAPALLTGPWAFFRAINGAIRRSTREKVESLLDRIAHDELD